jgi:hypothetical protein
LYNHIDILIISRLALRLLYLTLSLDMPQERLYYRVPFGLQFSSGGSYGPEA